MKIAYVITRMDELGGPQIHLRDLATRLTPMGHQVHIISGTDGPILHDLTTRGLATCHVLPDMMRAIKPWREPLALYHLYRLLRQIRPDLVSCHSSKAGVLGRAAAFLGGYKCVFTVHGWAFTDNVPRLKRMLYRAIETLMSPFCARILTVSDYDRRIGQHAWVAPARKMVTVHNGMSDIQLPPRGAHTGPCRLIMVARFAEQKDHRLLIDALATLRHLDWQVDLVGNGDTSVVAEQIARLGLSDRVHVLGQRGNAEVTARLSASDIFLLITHWEGFPRSIIEAMRAGLPVIATSVAGVPEAVVDGVTGHLVPHGDAVAVADAITDLVQNHYKRLDLGQAGRARFEQYFTFDHMFAQTCQIYTVVTGLPIYPRAVDNQTQMPSAA